MNIAFSRHFVGCSFAEMIPDFCLGGSYNGSTSVSKVFGVCKLDPPADPPSGLSGLATGPACPSPPDPPGLASCPCVSGASAARPGSLTLPGPAIRLGPSTRPPGLAPSGPGSTNQFYTPYSLDFLHF
jgi:hypothetical protein